MAENRPRRHTIAERLLRKVVIDLDGMTAESQSARQEADRKLAHLKIRERIRAVRLYCGQFRFRKGPRNASVR